MRLETFYIKELRDYTLQGVPYNGQAPTEFKTITYKGKMHIIDHEGDNRTFIRGVGWVKTANLKVTTIPVWDGEVETLAKYMEDYGMEALYRSMTFRDIYDGDCVSHNARNEFYSIVRYCLNDLPKYNTFVTKYRRFLEMEKEAVTRLIKKEWWIDLHLETNSLRPQYTVMGMVTMPPSVQVLNAEGCLRNLAIQAYNTEHEGEEGNFIDVWDTKVEYLDNIFNNRNIPEMVEYFYGKEAADLYNELEAMYAPEDREAED